MKGIEVLMMAGLQEGGGEISNEDSIALIYMYDVYNVIENAHTCTYTCTYVHVHVHVCSSTTKRH